MFNCFKNVVWKTQVSIHCDNKPVQIISEQHNTSAENVVFVIEIIFPKL